MRKRAGIILVLTGLMLLIKPNFDFDQIMMAFNYIVANYWPVGFVLIGGLLIVPEPKKTTKKRKRLT